MDNTSSEERFAGHRRALAEAGIAFTEELMGVFDTPEEPNAAVVHRIMAHRRHPAAFFCSNDGIAANLLDELAALGYRVPEDVELATVDDNELASALEVPLITASQLGEEMGRRSADILLRRIAKPGEPPHQEFLKAKVNYGGKG
jgi:DNA-binding LacI/PurR family transcriptional regulator